MKSKGFSLIELLIVVMILGIISAIAFPAYTQYVTRTKRADAMGALMTAASAMERYRASKFNYNRARISDGPGTQGIISGNVPADSNGNNVSHQLRFEGGVNVNDSDDAYTLVATPLNDMVGKDGALTINQRGEKTWTDKDGNLHRCWPESGGDDCVDSSSNKDSDDTQ